MQIFYMSVTSRDMGSRYLSKEMPLGRVECRPERWYRDHMHRVLAIAVLSAAAAFPPSVAGQMRSMPRPTGPVQAKVSHFRVPPPTRFGVMRPNSFAETVVSPIRSLIPSSAASSSSAIGFPSPHHYFCRIQSIRRRTTKWQSKRRQPSRIERAIWPGRSTGSRMKSSRSGHPSPYSSSGTVIAGCGLRTTVNRRRITQNNRMDGPPHRRAVVQASRQENFQPLCSPFGMDARKR